MTELSAIPLLYREFFSRRNFSRAVVRCTSQVVVFKQINARSFHPQTPRGERAEVR